MISGHEGKERYSIGWGTLKWRTCPPLCSLSRNSIRSNMEVSKISVGSLFTQLEYRSMEIQSRTRPTIDGGCVRQIVLHTEFWVPLSLDGTIRSQWMYRRKGEEEMQGRSGRRPIKGVWWCTGVFSKVYNGQIFGSNQT
jgi:hypothetical protein